VLYGLDLPGDRGLSFIPLIGPILQTASNPFLSGDGGAWTLAVLSTVAQVAGLGVAAFGAWTQFGSGSGGHAMAGFHGRGWALVPTVTPHGGFGVSLVSTR
jgi:hypothetical protein